MHLLNIERRDTVLRDELHVVQVERSRSGSIGGLGSDINRSLRNRPAEITGMSDTTPKITNMNHKHQQSFQTQQPIPQNILRSTDTPGIDCYNDAIKQKHEEIMGASSSQNEESMYVTTSRQFSNEKAPREQEREVFTEEHRQYN